MLPLRSARKLEDALRRAHASLSLGLVSLYFRREKPRPSGTITHHVGYLVSTPSATGLLVWPAEATSSHRVVEELSQTIEFPTHPQSYHSLLSSQIVFILSI